MPHTGSYLVFCGILGLVEFGGFVMGWGRECSGVMGLEWGGFEILGLWCFA